MTVTTPGKGGISMGDWLIGPWWWYAAMVVVTGLAAWAALGRPGPLQDDVDR